jgi:hypothetical protein
MADDEDCGCSMSDEEMEMLDRMTAKLYGPSSTNSKIPSVMVKSEDSPALNMTVDIKQAFNAQLIGECLSSHELSPTDIKWALERDLMMLSDEQLAIISVHLCKDTDIGKFSLCFNFSVDQAIINRDSHTWNQLLHIESKNAFPEFYFEIDKFTKNEQKTIQELYTTEYNAVYKLVKSMNSTQFPLKQYLIRKCPFIKLGSAEISSSPFSTGGVTAHGRKNVTMYQQCYDEVCMLQKTDIQFLNKENGNVIMVPDIESFETTAGTISMNTMTCVSLIRLLDFLVRTRTEVVDTNGNKMISAYNPATKQFFQPQIYNMLQRRLSIPIKLYEYFINKCQSHIA